MCSAEAGRNVTGMQVDNFSAVLPFSKALAAGLEVGKAK